MHTDQDTGLAEARAINHLPESGVMPFLRDQLAARHMHVIVRRLNAAERSSNPECRAQASAALQRLGFV